MFNGRGKTSSIDDDANINPVITYRHLLKDSGVHNPLRVVSLCDMDCFYAACEVVRLGIDPTRPVVVLQWNALIAVNYPARTYGIKRMTKLDEAKKMCPDLVVVHVATFKDGETEPAYHDDPNTKTHKVSLDHYRRESTKIINIVKRVLVGAEVEKASIDESFIDFTEPVRFTLLERYPHLAQVPVDSPLGLDTPLPPPPNGIEWHSDSNVVPIIPVDETEVAPPVPGPATWHDVGLNIAAEMLFKAREEIRTVLGYTTSAGIARNKFLAKLAASFKKPASQNVLINPAIPNYLKPMPFQKIRFLGGKLGAVLAGEYEAETVGDLLSISLNEIQNKFGPEALWVYQILRGVDTTEVKEKAVNAKSMLASKNLPRPITNDKEYEERIKVLCSELALRLNDVRQEGNVWPKSLVMHTRQPGEAYTGRSKQAAFPFVRDLNSEVIFKLAGRLWRELHGSDASRAARPNAKPLHVFHVALAFSGIDAMQQGQKGIESFLTATSLVKPLSSSGGGTKRPREEDVEEIKESSPDIEQVAEVVYYECPKCRTRLAVELEIGDDPTIRAQKTAAIRLEHEDFHFAQSLLQQDRVVLGKPTSSTSTAQNKTSSTSIVAQNKKRKPNNGANIGSYFSKK